MTGNGPTVTVDDVDDMSEAGSVYEERFSKSADGLADRTAAAQALSDGRNVGAKEIERRKSSRQGRPVRRATDADAIAKGSGARSPEPGQGGSGTLSRIMGSIQRVRYTEKMLGTVDARSRVLVVLRF